VIVGQIKDSCRGRRGDFDHRRAIGLLEELIIVLKTTLAELRLVVVTDLYRHGSICSVRELAQLIGGIVILIVEALYAVLKLVGFGDFTLCRLIAQVGDLLCQLLRIVLPLVEGLLVEVIVVVKPYHDHFKYVRYDEFLKIFGL